MHSVIHSAAQELKFKKQQAVEAYLQKRQPNVFFEQYGRALDKMLGTLWCSFFSDSRLCLLAIGGYGRDEMYPHSDLDLAIVSESPLTEEQHTAIVAFIQTLWDMQLVPAAKSGSIAELCESARNDLTADTAFLEARFVCGNHLIAECMMQALDCQRSPAAFIESKLLEMQQRHGKQQGSGAVLEPNVKTCPGGLRDIHTMLWLAKVQGLKADVHTLIGKNIITRLEAGLLMSSHRQLARVRIELHLATQREEDRLVFDLQTQVAANMELRDDNKRIKSEKLMHAFYRATKTVKQLNGIILPMLRGRVYSLLPRIVHTIDDDYYQVGNHIAVRDKKLFKKQPEHIFKIIEIVQKRNDITNIAPKTLRAWWAATQKIDRSFYDNPANRERFIGFFKQGGGLTHTLRFLNLYGVLGHYLPAWGKIVGLLQHDLFHIYPVDDHILMVLRNMRRLAIEAHAHELPFASALMHSFEKRHILYLAALFHDIAKGRGGDHAVQGIVDAVQFARDHGLDEEETAWLAWLVEDHLLMSVTAQKEDIQDPDVVKRFCGRVQNGERLKSLYLLTVADIRGTNPKIWNSWKANLLENLFQAAMRYFSGQADSRSVLTSRRQMSAEQALTDLGYTAKQQRYLWQVLGAAYFVRHEEDDIRWHIEHLIGHEETPLVCTRRYQDTHTLQVMVYMPNAPRLFSRLCRIFSHHNLDIVAARAFITEHNYILDTFVVQFPEHCQESDFVRIQQRLEHELNSFLNGAEPENARTCGVRSRRARHLPIAPAIQIAAEEDYPGWYTLDIVAINRPYLLSNVSEVFNDFGISLRYAKINTLDERVEDSFLVYCTDLDNPNNQLALKRALLEQLAV